MLKMGTMQQPSPLFSVTKHILLEVEEWNGATQINKIKNNKYVVTHAVTDLQQ